MQHAYAGGELGVDGKHYLGGEFLPFYIPRPRMPQVDYANYPELVAWLHDQGIETALGYCEPKTLRAHQRIDWALARTINENGLVKPVLTSSDNYILDGNHRWAGHVWNGTRVRYLRIDRPFVTALDVLFLFPKTYSYGDGHEHPVPA